MPSSTNGDTRLWIASYVGARVKAYGRPGLLGIEGLPYSGKTTLAQCLLRNAGHAAAEEHMERVSPVLLQEPWPVGDCAKILERQLAFLRVEEARALTWERVAAVNGRLILDRTFVSLIVYLWARLKFEDKLDEQESRLLLMRFLERMDGLMANGKLLVPESWCLLQPLQRVRDARQKALVGRDDRNTEAFLLNPETCRTIESVQATIFNGIEMATRTLRIDCDVPAEDIARRLSPLVL